MRNAIEQLLDDDDNDGASSSLEKHPPTTSTALASCSAESSAFLILAETFMAAQGPRPSFADFAEIPSHGNPFSVREGGVSKGDFTEIEVALQKIEIELCEESKPLAQGHVMNLSSLPAELLAQMAFAMQGLTPIAFGRSCKALASAVLRSDSLWSAKLQQACGFTAAGLELWQRRRGGLV